MPLTLSGTSGVLDNSGAFIAGTAVASTSGTSIDFTGIPSWVKRITVMFDSVSLSGTSGLLVQLGDSGGVETTGYSTTVVNDSGSTATDSTSGFVLVNAGLSAATSWRGALYLSLVNTNTFVGTATLTRASGAQYSAGVKSTSATLDRVRITTINGTDTFDAGTVNILYE
jgi:hypothetical protein